MTFCPSKYPWIIPLSSSRDATFSELDAPLAMSLLQRDATGTHHRGRNRVGHVRVLHELRKEQREQLAAIESEHDILHRHQALPLKPW